MFLIKLSGEFYSLDHAADIRVTKIHEITTAWIKRQLSDYAIAKKDPAQREFLAVKAYWLNEALHAAYSLKVDPVDLWQTIRSHWASSALPAGFTDPTNMLKVLSYHTTKSAMEDMKGVIRFALKLVQTNGRAEDANFFLEIIMIFMQLGYDPDFLVECVSEEQAKFGNLNYQSRNVVLTYDLERMYFYGYAYVGLLTSDGAVSGTYLLSPR